MRERSHEVTRLEGFSDAVFGFALTLLVVRLETPRTVADLEALVRGSLPFAVMFAMVCHIWWEHNVFFRRYGRLQDAWTVFLNSILLFVVLFYVYPLKFLTTSLLGPVFGVADSPGMPEGRYVMLVYGAGVILIFGSFVLLYQHAWRKRALLELSDADEVELGFRRRKNVLTAAVGVASVIIAAVSPEGPMMGVAGMTYCLIGPLHAWNGARMGRALTALAPKN